jgi:hypothetical protein
MLHPCRTASATVGEVDAYVSVPDPDALSTELASRGVPFSAPVADTDDGLRGFEVRDPDGYVFFFGRPK